MSGSALSNVSLVRIASTRGGIVGARQVRLDSGSRVYAGE